MGSNNYWFIEKARLIGFRANHNIRYKQNRASVDFIKRTDISFVYLHLYMKS